MDGNNGGNFSRRGVIGAGAAALLATGVASTVTGCESTPATQESTKDQVEPSDHIVDQQQQLAKTLPFDDTRDFADTDRGFVAALEPDVVKDANGKVVWDNDSYSFIRGTCPNSVHPSLWRQSQLVVKQGLYEVVPGIYQVRGLDLSNMTIIEGATGIIVIDPLISQETAAAALKLYRDNRGNRPVTGMIYTHSHVDHFGGGYGVTTPEEVAAGRVPVLAPTGFMDHAVSENIYAGTAMARRSAYMYGAALPRGEKGQVGAGLGQTTSTGVTTLIPPTRDIATTGQEEVLDGVRIVFQMTPGTEAPAEMNFYFPEHRAMCIAENATHTMHNVLTLRGALVRDPHEWAKYLTEAINMFAGKSDVAFASHHWPTWGTDNIVNFLSSQRDMFGYLNDQTLRMLNQGYVGSEIAEMMQMPPALVKQWNTHGYYGTVSHNVKAVYQRYMGWFDGNPAHLWEHPPVESAKRHVAAMGGAREALSKAQRAYDDGDYRWATQILNYLIFADPGNDRAKMLQASTFEQLGYGAEAGTWRNFYLSGAYELRNGSFGTPTSPPSPSMLDGLTVEQVFDALALQINGPKAWDLHLTTDWTFTDENRTHRAELRNGVLVHWDRTPDDGAPAPDATFTLTRPELIGMLMGGQDPAAAVQSGALKVGGNPSVLAQIKGVVDKPDPNFAIVTP
ncbi:alkyl/aryl-sulfatase [Nocardia sp. XZ_19_385]|uniref:alkyl/aryl-sulfatase n=1 Tax=Nocardia sp. XZ_19_385 TaxID=2769488 RepID=UPI00189023BB|nr:alkyl sulfatase dimerization domain-containing protein [Nocardia sp. XZ_19_385]